MARDGPAPEGFIIVVLYGVEYLREALRKGVMTPAEEFLTQPPAFQPVFLILRAGQSRIMKKCSQYELLRQHGRDAAAGCCHQQHQVFGMAPDTVMMKMVMGGKEYRREKLMAMIEQGE